MKVRHRQTYYALSLLAGDIVAIFGALMFSYWFRFFSGLLPARLGAPAFTVYAPLFVLVLVIMLFVFRAQGLYVEEKISRFVDEVLLLIRAVTVATLVLLGLSFFFREYTYSRGYFFVAWLSVLVTVALARAGIGFAYIAYRRRHNKFNEVLMVGANPISAKYMLRNRREPRLCTRVIGLLDDRYPALKRYRTLPVWGRASDLDKVLREYPQVNAVVVTTPDLPHADVIKALMICEKHLVGFKWLPDVLGLVATQMRVRYEFGLPLLGVKESPLSDWENRILKRGMDFVLSAAALIVLSPALGLIALAVKLDSPGKCLYKQDRVGEDGRIFKLCKFRTMQTGAEAGTGPVWAKENDSRRTRIGQFLRKTNFDELPQLWNVLKGDMSLVGPRPERPFFVGRFREDIPRYMGRHYIKSGITGWAQVNGLRGNTSIEERTKYDLFYIENWSVFLDIKILFMTLFSYKNAY